VLKVKRILGGGGGEQEEGAFLGGKEALASQGGKETVDVACESCGEGGGSGGL